MRRLIALVFSALALAALAWDLWRGPFQEKPLAFTTTAEIWQSVHVSSLIGFNAFIEKNLSTGLWDLVVLPALSWPAFVLAGLFAGVFFLISGRSARRKHNERIFPRSRR